MSMSGFGLIPCGRSFCQRARNGMCCAHEVQVMISPSAAANMATTRAVHQIAYGHPLPADCRHWVGFEQTGFKWQRRDLMPAR